MLQLKQNDKVIQSVPTGAWFSLPNGDVVSPAYAGWSSRGYLLVVEEPADTQPLVQSPTRDEQELLRLSAYRGEADPLFFKWQAGEGTEEEWKAKRQEIRDRYPYPVPPDAEI